MSDEDQDPTFYDILRRHICNTLRSIDNPGQVHDRARWSGSWEDLLGLFAEEENDGSGQKFKGWMVSRIAINPPTEEVAQSFGTITRVHVFSIQVMQAFNDELDSEGDFNDLLDRAMKKLDTSTVATTGIYPSLPAGYSIPPYAAVPSRVDNIDTRRFSSVLSHYATLIVELPVTEVVNF